MPRSSGEAGGACTLTGRYAIGPIASGKRHAMKFGMKFARDEIRDRRRCRPREYRRHARETFASAALFLNCSTSSLPSLANGDASRSKAGRCPFLRPLAGTEALPLLNHADGNPVGGTSNPPA